MPPKKISEFASMNELRFQEPWTVVRLIDGDYKDQVGIVGKAPESVRRSGKCRIILPSSNGEVGIDLYGYTVVEIVKYPAQLAMEHARQLNSQQSSVEQKSTED